MRHARILAPILAAACTLLFSGNPATALRSTYTVNSTADDPDAALADGICATPSGACTLRAAIQQANETTAADDIAFNIPGVGPHTIMPTSPLPAISSPLGLDGYTQPGAKPDEYPFWTGSDAILKIELDGSLAGAEVDGLRLTATGSIIRGLAVNHFGGYGFRLTSGARLIGNYVGTDATGDAAAANRQGGILLTAPGEAGRIESNLISGNSGPGATVVSDGNVFIAENMIGTAADGVTPMGNTASGILVDGAIMKQNNCCNTIAYNGGNGVEVVGVKARIRLIDNFIHSNAGLGIDLGGDGVTPNDSLDADSGPNALQNFPVLQSVKVNQAGITVRLTLDSTPGGPHRIEFSSNPQCDDSGHGEGQTLVGLAYVFTNASGHGKFDGQLSGKWQPVPVGHFVTATATPNELLVSGTSEFSACQVAEDGRTTVNSTGDASDANLTDNTCATATGKCTLRAAIQQAAATPEPDEIAFNIPGAGPHTILPASPLPNLVGPLVIDGYTQPGATPDSDQSDYVNDAVLKIEIDGSLAGPDANGLEIPGDPEGPYRGGVWIKGLAINRFARNGIMYGPDYRSYGHIEGNFIGTDVLGNTGLGNGSSGLRVAVNALIRNNVLSGNDEFGLDASGLSDSGDVSGNLIGTNARGNAAIPNLAGGAALGTPIDISFRDNLVSGNAGPGLTLLGAFDTYVGRNLIGTQANGILPLGNSGSGIRVASTDPSGVGDSSYSNLSWPGPNTIAFNNGAGIELVEGGWAIVIGTNSIHSNGGLGIDLGGDGVTLNDHLDKDYGPNEFQNFPEITRVRSMKRKTTITGRLTSEPYNGYYGRFGLSFYASPACDPSGHGEGAIPLGTVAVVTDDLGFASFRVTLPVAVPRGYFVAATTTGVAGTSEFSRCRRVH